MNIRRNLAMMFGAETHYHVAASYTRQDGSSSCISMTIKVKPWIHPDNYKEVSDFMGKHANFPKGDVCVTSITKLGR